MRKQGTIDIILICIIVFAIVFPMILYRKSIGITVYSIISLGVLLLHLLFGFLAYVFRHKGNYIAWYRILRHPLLLIFSSDKSYAFNVNTLRIKMMLRHCLGAQYFLLDRTS